MYSRRPQCRGELRDVGEEISWDRDFVQLENDESPYLTTFGPILISFSYSVVIDHFLIGSGVARVRSKLSKL